MENRTYIAIDLKSFYASVECMERGLDPPDHPTLLSLTQAVPKKPFVSPSHPLLKHMVYLAERGCLRSCRRLNSK